MGKKDEFATIRSHLTNPFCEFDLSQLSGLGSVRRYVLRLIEKGKITPITRVVMRGKKPVMVMVHGEETKKTVETGWYSYPDLPYEPSPYMLLEMERDALKEELVGWRAVGNLRMANGSELYASDEIRRLRQELRKARNGASQSLVGVADQTQEISRLTFALETVKRENRNLSEQLAKKVTVQTVKLFEPKNDESDEKDKLIARLREQLSSVRSDVQRLKNQLTGWKSNQDLIAELNQAMAERDELKDLLEKSQEKQDTDLDKVDLAIDALWDLEEEEQQKFLQELANMGMEFPKGPEE